VFGEFWLLKLCRLNLFKFYIKVLKTKRIPIHPPLGPSILTIAPPLSYHKVESSSRHRTTPHPSHMQEVESFSRRHTAPPTSSDSDDSMVIPPPPPTHVVECPHIKEVSSYGHCVTSPPLKRTVSLNQDHYGVPLLK
jgi:hypothetical protein